MFHDVAYKARCREDLLAGIDEFLDKVKIVLSTYFKGCKFHNLVNFTVSILQKNITEE